MTIQQKILISGTDDWVYLAEVVDLVRKENELMSEQEIVGKTIKIIEELARNGLMEIGDLSGEKGRFKPWQLSVDESLIRILKEWLALGEPITIGQVCWLCNTPKGNTSVENL